MNTSQKFLENTDNITQVLFDKTTENEEFPINARNLLTQKNKEFIKDAYSPDCRPKLQMQDLDHVVGYNPILIVLLKEMVV